MSAQSSDNGSPSALSVGAGATSGAAAGSMLGPIGAVAGAGLGIAGALITASDQASLDAEKAQVAQEQSTEIQAREVANENLRDQQAYRQKLQFGAAYAGSGKAGTGVGSQLEIQRQTDQQNMVSNREAQFQEQMLQQQAGVDTTLGQETQTAGYINAASSAISGASRVGSMLVSGNRNPALGGVQSTGFG